MRSEVAAAHAEEENRGENPIAAFPIR